MKKEIEIPEGYEARIEGNKVIFKLKESEDERIRKELLEVIKHCYEDGGYALCTDDYKKYSAYLEKQRESTWTEEDDIFERNILPRILDPSRWTLEQNNADKHRLEEFVDRQKNKSFEKQKEQKPNIELIQKSWYLEGYHDGKYNIEPKWLIQTGKGGPMYEENPKYGTQQPAEWSEEDNEKIERLRSIVNECAFRNDALDVNGDYCEGDYEELDDWLKSRRWSL